jgi:hypothetical protein
MLTTLKYVGSHYMNFPKQHVGSFLFFTLKTQKKVNYKMCVVKKNYKM